jgi:hypothetical protein
MAPNRREAGPPPSPSPRRYTTKQAADQIGIAKSTLLEWLRIGNVPEPPFRDRRGWRVWGPADIARVIEYRDRLQPAPQRQTSRRPPAVEKVHS